MTDGPQLCALPGCSETVEQPDDGGPRRLYCSPAHRAAARKMRHAARMETGMTQPVPAGPDVTEPISTEPISTEPISTNPLFTLSDLPQPIASPADRPDEPAAPEPPAPLASPRQEDPDPTPAPDREWSPAAAWTISPPALPPALPPTGAGGRTVRTITSKRVKKEKPARTAGDRKKAAATMRRRAVASVAIASLVAGGASYMVNENIIPTTPTPLPPQASPQPSMEADVWAGQAQVVLASLSSQLDAVAQAEAAWVALPEQRRAQEPDAVQALKDRKALLEQQRATLMSQLEALRALPDVTTELTTAQAQLDAVERTLKESTATAASPDYQEAVRQLAEQRELRRQQRDHAAQQLSDLRDGVENALSAPLPEEKDETTPIVERVRAVVEGRPDPADQDNDGEHNAADGQDPAATPRREDDGEERSETGTTAPPDPERPSIPDVLADGARESRADADRRSQDLGSRNDSGGDEREGPLRSVGSTLGGVLGGDDDRSERDDNDRGSGLSDRDDDRDDDRGGLGDVVRGVGGGLFGGDRDDDRDDDRGDRDSDREDNRDDDRDDDRGDRDDDRGGWGGWGDRGNDRDGDRDERDDRGDEDDDRGGLGGLTDGLVGGSDRDGSDSDDERAGEERGGDEERADSDDNERKRPIGKAERERQRAGENDDRSRDSRSDSDKRDSDKRDSDKRDSDKRDSDKRDSDKRDSDKRDSDKRDSDKRDSDKRDSDKRDSDDRDSDKRDSDDRDSDDRDSDDRDSDDDDSGDRDSDDDSGDSGDSDSGDSDSGDSDSGDSDSGDSDSGDSDSGGDD